MPAHEGAPDMSALARYRKTPNEIKSYAISWQDWLDDGETVTSINDITPTVETGSPLTPIVVDSSAISADGTEVAFFISAGHDGATYQVVVEITTSAGQVKEDCILIAVRDC